jgi:hypothetical protein
VQFDTRARLPFASWRGFDGVEKIMFIDTASILREHSARSDAAYRPRAIIRSDFFDKSFVVPCHTKNTQLVRYVQACKERSYCGSFLMDGNARWSESALPWGRRHSFSIYAVDDEQLLLKGSYCHCWVTIKILRPQRFSASTSCDRAAPVGPAYIARRQKQWEDIWPGLSQVLVLVKRRGLIWEYISM